MRRMLARTLVAEGYEIEAVADGDAALAAVERSVPDARTSSAFAADARVSNASPAGSTPRNHQNEPAVAIDQSRPNVLAAGWNDFVDQQPCPLDATGTCLNEINGAGLSAVGFSFDDGRSWIQPTTTGWTTADCTNPDVECTGSEGPINTPPWYYESGLVSEGDPAVAFGPRLGANGRFSWANGSRLYFANLVGRWNPAGSDVVFPGEIFHGLIGLGVSRADNVTAANVREKSTWQRPVVINAHSGQNVFEDKEQIWADNAASSPNFGDVYLCNAEFRSLGSSQSRHHAGTVDRVHLRPMAATPGVASRSPPRARRGATTRPTGAIAAARSGRTATASSTCSPSASRTPAWWGCRRTAR